MLKWIAGAVLSAMGVEALAGPLTDAVKPDNAATKLVQAAGRANNQAGDLGSSYADNDAGHPQRVGRYVQPLAEGLAGRLVAVIVGLRCGFSHTVSPLEGRPFYG